MNETPVIKRKLSGSIATMIITWVFGKIKT